MTSPANSWRHLTAAWLLVGLVCPGAFAAPPEAIVLSGRTMGTTYRLKYWGPGEQSPTQVQAAVDALLAEFDRQMSTYREDSELSRFNLAPPGEWFEVSAATANVVALAIDLHRRTGGAYDVTVAPALRLWNFGPEAGRNRQLAAPSDEQMAAVRRIVGTQLLEARHAPPALRKAVDGVEVDLSSIAPGYAVDLLVELLSKTGFPNAIVEVGGEVRGVGLNSTGEPWRVGVEQPVVDPPTLAMAISLRDMALSTSGDYRNFRKVDGRRYAHILDPRTLRPLPYRGMSVTALAKTCAEADALGTALSVMGPEAGRAWCVEHDVAAMFQFRANDAIERVTTPRFEELIAPDSPSK